MKTVLPLIVRMTLSVASREHVCFLSFSGSGSTRSLASGCKELAKTSSRAGGSLLLQTHMTWLLCQLSHVGVDFMAKGDMEARKR